MKKIKRPDSTTYILEFPFHEIKDETEAKNVMQGHTVDDIFVVLPWVDQKSFKPKLAFAMRQEGKDFYHWEKYITDVGLLNTVCGYVRK